MNPLYNTGLRLYSAAARLAALRGGKARLLVDGQRHALEAAARMRAACAPTDTVVWIHAASLGEFEQGRPLIEKLRAERPDVKIMLTFFSPSGYEVRRNYDRVDGVAYLPFDVKSRAKAFLDALRPSVAIFIKYEFWGNYLQELRRRGVPTYLVSGIFRPSQPFFKWWGGMFRGMLGCYTRLYVQNAESARLLAGIGVTNVEVTGDTRLDRVYDIMSRSAGDPDIERFVAGGDPVLIAGSSWPADEDVYIPALKATPSLKSIVASHEFDAARLSALRERLGEGAMTLSDYRKAVAAGKDVASVRHLVVDCFGLLSAIYRYATVVHVGGGFGAGIHNINEAAVWGKPVTFGPNNRKFREAADLIAAGAAAQVDNADEFARRLALMLADPAARKRAGDAAAAYIAANKGATDRIFTDIFR